MAPCFRSGTHVSGVFPGASDVCCVPLCPVVPRTNHVCPDWDDRAVICLNHPRHAGSSGAALQPLAISCYGKKAAASQWYQEQEHAGCCTHPPPGDFHFTANDARKTSVEHSGSDVGPFAVLTASCSYSRCYSE